MTRGMAVPTTVRLRDARKSTVRMPAKASILARCEASPGARRSGTLHLGPGGFGRVEFGFQFRQGDDGVVDGILADVGEALAEAARGLLAAAFVEGASRVGEAQGAASQVAGIADAFDEAEVHESRDEPRHGRGGP